MKRRKALGSTAALNKRSRHKQNGFGGRINSQARRLLNRAIRREAIKQTGAGPTLSLIEKQLRLKGRTPRLSLVHFGDRKGVNPNPVAKYAYVSAYYNPFNAK